MSAGFKKGKKFFGVPGKWRVLASKERISSGFGRMGFGIIGFLPIFAIHQAMGISCRWFWSRSSMDRIEVS
jgi:hypothetical protein